jgi:Tfp pilus assembly protein PilF
LNLALFLESLENLSAAEFGHFAAEATSAARSSARSACLALCAIGTGDGEAAARWIEDAIHIDRPSDFVSFASALVSMQTGNIASAIEPLRKIDERFVKYRDARVLLATAYLYSGDVAEAENVALGIDDQDDEMRASLLGLRARCAQARTDESSARSLYRQALTYAPQLEWVRQELKSQTDLQSDTINSPDSALNVVVI